MIWARFEREFFYIYPPKRDEELGDLCRQRDGAGDRVGRRQDEKKEVKKRGTT